MLKSKEKSEKQERNKHHIVPRSRKRFSRKTIELPSGFHTALHIVFGNLYGEEMEVFIREFNKLLDRNKITGEDLEALRTKIKKGVD